MKEELKYWLWIKGIKGLGNITAKKLLETFKTPERIYFAAKAELKAVPGIGEATAEGILSQRKLYAAECMLERMSKNNIRLLTINDSLYPLRAKEIMGAPIILYYIGTLEKERMAVAVVGARRCTEYGKTVANDAATFLASHGVSVISGMAKGIDSYAHTACIKAGGHTLAFLGHGVDLCYPKEHVELKEAIIRNGAILSEYPPGTPIRQVHFPQRNYLISAWAHKVLVVEAGLNSGALITAKLAQEQQRKVLAVPNSIYCRQSQGSNRLLADGAEIYLHPGQLIEESITAYSLQKKPVTIKTRKKRLEVEVKSENSSLEERILKELEKSNRGVEDLALSFGEDKKMFLEIISTMEIEGKIKRLPGGSIISCGNRR